MLVVRKERCAVRSADIVLVNWTRAVERSDGKDCVAFWHKKVADEDRLETPGGDFGSAILHK